MKRSLAIPFLVLSCMVCTLFSACGNEIPVDEIKIEAPSSTKIKAGETFRLSYTVVPEEAAQTATVDWEIDDPARLSYTDGSFTALTCGNVKVRVCVKGGEATDEIELQVVAPDGYTETKGNGYVLIRPTDWTASSQGNIRVWTAKNATTNMNVTTEELKTAYFTNSESVLAASFQAVIETTYNLLNATVTFTQPVSVQKETYLGVQRLRVEYQYRIVVGGIESSLHQTQYIFNNEDAKLSCALTITYAADDYNNSAKETEKKITDQFLPR